MAEVTIYHNPNCNSSTNAVNIAKELGVDAEVVLYLKTPPDAATLGTIIDKLDDPVTDLVRRDKHAAQLELGDALASCGLHQRAADQRAEHTDHHGVDATGPVVAHDPT